MIWSISSARRSPRKDVLRRRLLRPPFAAGDKKLYKDASDRFLRLILLQDELLATRPEFKVGTWIARARSLGGTPEEKELYEWNARVQITTWGNRLAADEGGLRDYAHREWNGILKDFYYMRWKTWFDYQTRLLDGRKTAAIDFLCNRGTLDESNKCLFERTGRRLYFDSKTYICGNIRQIT